LDLPTHDTFIDNSSIIIELTKIFWVKSISINIYLSILNLSSGLDFSLERVKRPKIKNETSIFVFKLMVKVEQRYETVKPFRSERLFQFL